MKVLKNPKHLIVYDAILSECIALFPPLFSFPILNFAFPKKIIPLKYILIRGLE